MRLKKIKGLETFPFKPYTPRNKHGFPLKMGAPCLGKGDSELKKTHHFQVSMLNFVGCTPPVIVGMARLLGTVGEPINPEAWRWYYRVVGGGNLGWRWSQKGSRWLVVACWGFCFGWWWLWWWCFFFENMEKKI